MQLRHVDPRALSLVLRRLRQVPEAAVRAKLESLRTKGQLSPLLAAEQEGELVLVDGFARQAAAARLGLGTVLVQLAVLSPVQMKAQLYLCNRDRELALLDECRLVRELCEVDGLSQLEVAALLERHPSWVCRRLGMYKALSPRLVAEGAISGLEAGSIRRLGLLPACNQEQLLAVTERDGLGPREITRLIDLWRHAPDGEARRYLLEHPRSAIALAETQQAESCDPRLGPCASKVHQALLLMRQSALRMVRELGRGLEPLPEQGQQLLRQACELAERDCPWALCELRRHWTTTE